jgi:hypothetical protein
MDTQAQTKSYNLELLQKSYQADQQLKYMSLEAELELLLQQIKAAKTEQNQH